MKHPLTAITFSDSVFIATSYLFEAAAVAGGLVGSMLRHKVPLRVGVAFGSFAALGFRSDISPDSGEHAAYFLGTPVVRACQAEGCGIKGMRVLLHPSAEPLLADQTHNPGSLKMLECSGEECSNKAGVRYELNYWNFPKRKEYEPWRGLQDMWSSAPDFAAEHYQSTAEAINRMRMDQGEAPLSDLRIHELPRSRR